MVAALVTALTAACPAAAQFDFADRNAPPPLAEGPAWEVYLFERPWAPAVVFVIAALSAWWALRRIPGRTRHAMIALLGGILLAGGIVALASMVETDRELLRRRTVELVGATARAERAKVMGMLAEDAAIDLGKLGGRVDKSAILDRVDRDLGGAWAVKEWAVLENEAALGGLSGTSTGTVQVRVRVTLANPETPTFTWWKLVWRQNPDGSWQVRDITALSL